jgi:acetoin utilization protein AcuB
MFITRSMTRKVITIHPEAAVLEARDQLQRYKIHSLPVVGPEETLIGIVTDRDVRSALPAGISSEDELNRMKERLAGLQVKDIMTSQVVTLSPDNTLEDALLLMQQVHVGALPVIDRARKVLGIITTRDLLRGFTEVLGIEEPGTLLCILADDQQGQMKRIVDAITEEKIRFGSVLVARGWEKGKRAFFPYLFTHNTLRIKRKLEGSGFTLINPLDLYLEPQPPE